MESLWSEILITNDFSWETSWSKVQYQSIYDFLYSQKIRVIWQQEWCLVLHLKVFYFVTCVTFCICCILNMALTRQSVIPTYILSGEPISGEEDYFWPRSISRTFNINMFWKLRVPASVTSSQQGTRNWSQKIGNDHRKSICSNITHPDKYFFDFIETYSMFEIHVIRKSNRKPLLANISEFGLESNRLPSSSWLDP